MLINFGFYFRVCIQEMIFGVPRLSPRVQGRAPEADVVGEAGPGLQLQLQQAVVRHELISDNYSEPRVKSADDVYCELNSQV